MTNDRQVRGGDRRSGPAHARSRDRGSATLWAIAFAMVIWLVAAAVVVGGVAIAARHRAATAADLAALAGATVALTSATAGTGAAGTGSACSAAATVAQANGALLIDCDVQGQTVTVVAAVPLRGLAQLVAMRARSVRASARAGAG